MSKFKRGIENQDFIDALNKLREDENSFWNKMVNDPELFIAIRNESVNVYYRGNSICELKFINSKILGKTLYKYLLYADLDEYVKSSDGIFSLNNPSEKFITSLNDLGTLKKAIKVYSGVEKKGVHSISVKEKNVLDVEIAFSKQDSKLDRIDYLKIEEVNGSLKLVFYEAKHFTNTDIRAEQTPNVLEQIKKYEKTLKVHETQILESYSIVCKNLKMLDLIKPHHDNYIKRISEGESLSIDFEPRLIIFGFDQDQKDGINWGKHHIKLKNELKSRLKIKGNIN